MRDIICYSRRSNAERSIILNIVNSNSFGIKLHTFECSKLLMSTMVNTARWNESGIWQWFSMVQYRGGSGNERRYSRVSGSLMQAMSGTLSMLRTSRLAPRSTRNLIIWWFRWWQADVCDDGVGIRAAICVYVMPIARFDAYQRIEAYATSDRRR